MFLEPRNRALVRDILGRHVPVGVSVFVFGSRAHRRGVKPFSDLDICLKGVAPLPDTLIANLRQAFEDSDLPICKRRSKNPSLKRPSRSVAPERFSGS